MWRKGFCRGCLFVTLAPGLLAGPVLASGLGGEEASGDPVRPGSRPAAAGPDLNPPAGRAPTPRIHCEAPTTLRLRRFEDGSAQLRCAGRVIVRVSVPD